MRGLHTLRVKETDRIAALQNELTKLGATVEVDGDAAMTITPPETIDAGRDRHVRRSPHGDELRGGGDAVAGVVINDAECVNKTYPAFFDDLRRILD